MRKIISVILIIIGVVITIYGWQMRSMKESHEEIRTKTEMKESREEKNTKLRNAGIGAAIGAAALGTAAVIIGGIGVVAMGTGIGVPAGAGLIAGAAALGGVAGGISGAATGEQEGIPRGCHRGRDYRRPCGRAESQGHLRELLSAG